jgi:hypothetical protein
VSTVLSRRLDRLELSRPGPSPWDALDPILADLSLSDLIALVQRCDSLRRGIRPPSRQDAVYDLVRVRLAPTGIILP